MVAIVNYQNQSPREETPTFKGEGGLFWWLLKRILSIEEIFLGIKDLISNLLEHLLLLKY